MQAGPWWWSSGQHDCLLLRQFQFEFDWSLWVVFSVKFVWKQKCEVSLKCLNYRYWAICWPQIGPEWIWSRTLRVRWMTAKGTRIFLKKGHLSLFSIMFGIFKETIKNLQQINVKKYPASIQCWELNLWTLEHESSSKATRPGFLP